MAVVSKLPSDKHINIFLDAIMPDMPEDASMIIDCNVCHKIVKHTLNYRKHPDSLGSFQNCGRWFYHCTTRGCKGCEYVSEALALDKIDLYIDFYKLRLETLDKERSSDRAAKRAALALEALQAETSTPKTSRKRSLDSGGSSSSSKRRKTSSEGGSSSPLAPAKAKAKAKQVPAQATKGKAKAVKAEKDIGPVAGSSQLPVVVISDDEEFVFFSE